MLCFGLLADVQYSDMPDGNSEGRVQRYTEAPDKLFAAIKLFQEHAPRPAFVLWLGDLINGNNQHPVMFCAM